ncbi:MAG: BTAD domain-containing putative transcriptional regulator [Anaerolineae bacterium]|jgi:DNA-binding SARP family transcriptional activator
MNNGSDKRTLHIQLLGDFRLVYGNEAITVIDTPRLQSLLAYLLLHRDAPQSRHRLAFLFWPDSPEAQALTNLRNLLHRLRHELPDADHFLHVDRNTLQWRSDAPFELDVARFEQALDRAEKALRGAVNGARSHRATARAALEQAVALYEGDLLPSCYDDWIVPERERLRQAFERALGRLVRLVEDQQEYDAAIRYAQRLLRHDPLREASYRRLMRLRALIGDRAGALRTYHECATVLEREFGVQPSPVTREMYERLLALEETPRPPARPPGRMVAISPLVGRQEAWAQLRGDWRIASAGRPHLVLISGEAGIGKTRLAEELVQWGKRQGIATAAARCYASEGELAYAPVAAWLRALPLPRLDRVWLSEVARILPELLGEQPDLSPPGPLTESWQRGRFLEALARAVLGGNQPLLLLIDALQWCDRGTLEWLAYVLRFDPRARLLVVGAYRPEGIGDDHPLTSLRHALRQADQLTEIELDPLSKAETATLAANLANRDLEQNLIDCLYGETEGHPLFIVETVRAGLPDEVRGSLAEGFLCVPRPLPSRMWDALLARVDELSSSARALAEVAAAIGRDFTFDVLEEATDAGEGVLVRGLDELWQRGIVREQGEAAYDFSHDKLREVVYDELSAARRRMLHRHVARALETVYADDLDTVAAQIAAHYERGDEPEEAIEYYQRAAEVALRVQCEEDVTRYRQRASVLQEQVTTGGP